MVQSHDGSIRSVVEKGDALLASVHYPSIRDKMNRLQRDYTELCKRAMVRTCAQIIIIITIIIIIIFSFKLEITEGKALNYNDVEQIQNNKDTRYENNNPLNQTYIYK